MSTTERRKAEVARAWNLIQSHRPAPTTPTSTTLPTETLCRWCLNAATLEIEDPPGRAESYPSCEAHALRILEAGGRLANDPGGKRAAALIARMAVLRVKRTVVRNVKP